MKKITKSEIKAFMIGRGYTKELPGIEYGEAYIEVHDWFKVTDVTAYAYSNKFLESKTLEELNRLVM